MKPIAIGTGGQLAVGLLLGVASGLVGIYLGLMFSFAAVFLVVVVGAALGRLAGISGGLIGVGGTWLLLILNDLMRCPAPSTDCGGGDPRVTVAWLTVSALIAIVGASLGVWTLMVSRRSRAH